MKEEEDANSLQNQTLKNRSLLSVFTEKSSVIWRAVDLSLQVPILLDAWKETFSSLTVILLICTGYVL